VDGVVDVTFRFENHLSFRPSGEIFYRKKNGAEGQQAIIKLATKNSRTWVFMGVF
jgi:hypothetical protein